MSESAPHLSADGWHPQRRIPVLDSLRGVASLAVVVHHVGQAIRGRAEVGLGWDLADWLGAWGVALFFVLSGFCIHLPHARAELEGRSNVDWRSFARRRIWRLLPTHYVALVVAAVAAEWVTSPLLSRATLGNFLAHVAMVHTLSANTIGSINAVFWSIGLEVHFYASYPLYRWLRRRLGFWLAPTLGAVGLATYAGASLHLEGDWRLVGQRLFLTTWWQWALGATLADIYLRGRLERASWAMTHPWAAPLWGAASLALAWVDPVVFHLHVRFWLLPVACAMFLAALVVRRDAAGSGGAVEFLGRMSYSLYLIHPVALALTGAGLSGAPRALTAVAGVAASLASGWVFYQLVEKRFVNAPLPFGGARPG